MTTGDAHFSPDHLQKSMKSFRLGQTEMDEKLESNHILTMRTGLMEKALQC